MGKALGGGSSISVMVWARGHKNDWEHFAAESGDPAWGYESILGIYRRIEDWQGDGDTLRRGRGGPVHVEPSADPSPVALAMIEAAGSLGLATFDSPNGVMMEGAGGAAISDLIIRDGRRCSIFRSYVYPRLEQPNLTVLTRTLVSRLLLRGSRVVGVEVIEGSQVRRYTAGRDSHPRAVRRRRSAAGVCRRPRCQHRVRRALIHGASHRNRIGNVTGPAMPIAGRHVGSPSSSIGPSRRASSGSASAISRRAR